MMDINEATQHYVDVVFSTEAFTSKEAESWAKDFYTIILKQPVPKVEIVDNPKLMKDIIIEKGYSNSDIIEARRNIKYKLDKTIFSITYRVMLDKACAVPFMQLSEKIDKETSSITHKLCNEVFKGWLSFLEGAFDTYLYAPFQYCYDMGLLKLSKEEEKYVQTMTNSLKFGIIYPMQDTCYICKKPLVLSMIKSNKGNIQFHKDGGPAVVYPQWQEWYLNGVQVPRYIAETPSSLLDPSDIKDIPNADVRTEFIRKIGMERLVSMGTVMDTWENHKGTKNYKQYAASEYKLINMADVFKDGSSRSRQVPYLYMKNLSVPGVYHLECVFNREKQPKTILEALQIRLGGRNPEDYDLIAIK